MAKVEAQPYEFEFQPASCALVIIDMQRDFVDPGGFGEALGNDVSLLRKAKSRTRDDRSAEFRRLEADTGIQTGLGWFFAAKFRAAMLYALYERSNHRPALEEALKHYREARAAYAELADLAEVVYRRDLTYGYSDRCRYYWHGPAVQEEITRLFDNLGERPIPLTLVSQYLPLEYEAIRSGELQADPERLIEHHIRRVLRVYADACSAKKRA